MENNALELPKGGSISKRSMRRQIQKYFPKIISVLVADLDCRNPSVRVASAKVLINKILPDLKATELSGQGGQGIRVEFVDYEMDKNKKDSSTSPERSLEDK